MSNLPFLLHEIHMERNNSKMKNLTSLLSENTLDGIEKEGIFVIKAYFQKLYTVWKKLDLDPTQKTQRVKLTWSHINNLLFEILEEETDVYEDIKERVHNYSSKISLLSKALFLPAKEVDGSLIQREEALRQELECLNALKQKRKQAYQNLKNTVLNYCQILNLNDKSFTDPDVPSEDELQCLESRVSALKDEKEKRGRKFLMLKKELTTILETTELPPETSFEEDILSGKENFSLSNETFVALEEVIDKAKQRQSELESLKKELMGKLTVLWTILKVDEEEKVDFLSKHLDIRPSTLKSIQEELNRCERLKIQNMQLFVDALRQELEELWAVCHVSEHQRLQFESDATEVVLEKLEAEVARWQQYRENVAHILKKIERRQQLFDQLTVFENKSSDPKRFKNRKGGLLQEEQERKRLQKELPNLEDDLFMDIQAFEVENKTSFLYYGGDYRAFVKNQWSERKNQKESKRLKKHKQYLLKMQSELSSGAPVKRPTTRTPQSAPCKLFKPNTWGLESTPEATGCLTKAPSTVDRLTTKKCSPQKSVPTDSNGSVATNINSTTYSEFAAVLEMSSRNKMQSSILSTKTRGGTMISVNRKTKKEKQVTKQTQRCTRKSTRIVKTTPKFSPTRGKFGLPFLF